MRLVEFASEKGPEMDRECRLASQSALQGQDGVTENVKFRETWAIWGTRTGEGRLWRTANPVKLSDMQNIE